MALMWLLRIDCYRFQKIFRVLLILTLCRRNVRIYVETILESREFLLWTFIYIDCIFEQPKL